MFRWYRTAAIRYAYLSDVNDPCELERSRWFTRGWTLQELVAPKEVLFYSSNWTLLGTKLQISDKLCQITNIDTEVLATGAFDQVSIAGRMSWAASRQTTRVEDLAYCLMGIFDINMPLLYGEGKKAFIRLQEEILRVSPDDFSLFAWGLPANIRTGDECFAAQDYADGSKLHGIFADSPAAFTLCRQIQPSNWKTPLEAIPNKGGVKTTLPVWGSDQHLVAAIPFTLKEMSNCYLCIPLVRGSKNRVSRLGELVLVPLSGDSIWQTECLHITPPVSVRTQPETTIRHLNISQMLKTEGNLNYMLEEVYCLPHARYSAGDGEITLLETKEGPYAVLFFKRNFITTKLRLEEDLAKTKERVNHEKHTKPEGWINEFSAVEINSKQPRFAVLLGGTTTAYSGGLWIKFMHILDENRADEDFHTLFKRNAELVRHCATRSQIISALCVTRAPAVRRQRPL